MSDKINYPNDAHVSPHLTWSELACKDGTPWPDGPEPVASEWRAKAIVLAREFEAVRAFVGHQPLIVLSAYRTPSHNRKVGGVANSQHVQGTALDLRTPAGWTPDQFEAAVRRYLQANMQPHMRSRIRGMGRYSWGLHLDVRPGARLHYWRGAQGAGS